MPLRTRLILYFSAIVIVLVAILVLFINRDNSRQVQNYILRGGMYGFQDIVTTAEDYFQANGSWNGVAAVLDAARPGNMMGGIGGGMHGEPYKYSLTDANLNVIWSSAGEVVGSVLGETSKTNALTLESSTGYVIGYIVVSGRQVFQPAEVSPLINSLKTAVLRSGFIAGIIAILLAILFANQLIGPVKLLTKAADSLSQGNLSTRVMIKGKDEVAHLGKSFNSMAENLESAEARKKAMTADIAHELRSPLAVQKAQLEAMQDGVVPMNLESLQTVVEQTNFLTRLVDDLRTLALVDAGELPLQIEEVDYIRLVGQVIERFMPQAIKQQVNLEISNFCEGKQLLLNADPDRLTQILGNLITNALHHTPVSGIITLEVSKLKDKVVTSVRDTGSGIPEGDLPHLFERFYRGDKSRNRENLGSTGLGLSIARHLARVHGGDLTAENAKEGGALFTLTLPV
jgi:signal transduction histidine kinase